MHKCLYVAREIVTGCLEEKQPVSQDLTLQFMPSKRDAQP